MVGVRWCVDKRVVIGLGAVALVGLAVRPGWLVAALPLLESGGDHAPATGEQRFTNRDSGAAQERLPEL